ncbi:hypothetical protein ABT061_28625 [Streptosporangium sp. NPDC002544]|uniref:hypothetical protein n=1 Tax=Streptosporangium sp. NPDC002544 TaxID=3154538 RepID=UPI0033345763
MTLHMLVNVLPWVALLLGCALGAHGLYMLRTDRLPSWYRQRDQRSARSSAWSFLLMAAFIVMINLPRAMGWASSLVVAFNALAFVPLTWYTVLAVKQDRQR